MKMTSAQDPFHGSFLMSFVDSNGLEKDFPLRWQIQSGSSGGKMLLDLQDEMKKKGVSKRVLFSPKDSTWTMLLAYVNSKIGTRIHAAAMYRDTIRLQKVNVRKSHGKRVIEGYPCKKMILESADYIAEAWTTNQLNYDLCYTYQLMTHCGLMSDYVSKGDWFNRKDTKGMILEVTSTNKKTKEKYTMRLSRLIPGEVNESFFDLEGFKISEIPEGFNCGVPVNTN